MNSNQFEFVGLVVGTKLLHFFTNKMGRLHEGTYSLGLVPATSPIMCADLVGQFQQCMVL